jgi:hypothetical protein
MTRARTLPKRGGVEWQAATRSWSAPRWLMSKRFQAGGNELWDEQRGGAPAVMEGAAAAAAGKGGFVRLAAVSVGLLVAAKVWDRRALNRACSAAITLVYYIYTIITLQAAATTMLIKGRCAAHRRMTRSRAGEMIRRARAFGRFFQRNRALMTSCAGAKHERSGLDRSARTARGDGTASAGLDVKIH